MNLNRDYFEILLQLGAGDITVAVARERLHAFGFDPDLDEENILTALGGGDIMREGPDGKLYYENHDGTLGPAVEEIERKMEKR